MKINKQHKVQMTDERIKKIEYMLSLGISGNSICEYFSYQKNIITNYIKQEIIKDTRLKSHLNVSIEEINEIMEFKKIIEKEIFSFYDIRKRCNKKYIQLFYKCVELWDYKLSKTKIEEKKNKYQMVEIGWFVDLYEINEAEKAAIDYFIEEGYDIWGLRHCGADLIIKKNGVHTIVEVKTTLNRNTFYSAITQLLFGVDIIKKEFDISINNKMIVYINKNFQDNHYKRYMNHFNIRTLHIGKY